MNDTAALIKRCEIAALNLYNQIFRLEKCKEARVYWRFSLLGKAHKDTYTGPLLIYLTWVFAAIVNIAFGIYAINSLIGHGANPVIIIGILFLIIATSAAGLWVSKPYYSRILGIAWLIKHRWKPSFEALQAVKGKLESKNEKERYELLCIYNQYIYEHLSGRWLIKIPNWVAWNVSEANLRGVSADKIIGNRSVEL